MKLKKIYRVEWYNGDTDKQYNIFSGRSYM